VRKDTIVRLSRALADDDEPTVRAAAAVALGDLTASEALAALLFAIEDADGYVRQMAINALGEIADGRAAARLSRTLTDDRPEVRYQGIIAFARVAKDDPEAVGKALARALQDEDDSVRYIALRIAEERADTGIVDAELAVVARDRVEDPASHVALAAAIFVAKSRARRIHAGDGVDAPYHAGEKRAVDLILRVVSGDGPRPKGPAREDENEAILVAGLLGVREALPALERRTWGLGRFVRDTCSFSARIALARMGHARAVAEITRDLASSKKDAREAAIVAVGRARMVRLKEALLALGPDDADPELVTVALTELES
jgi:HEAT repeat protein